MTSTLTEVLGQIVRGPEETELFGTALRIDPCCASLRPGHPPTQAMVVTTVARRLIELSKEGAKLKTLLVAGETDPMRHPEFRQISENLRELGHKWFPKAHLALISDGTGLTDPDLRHSLIAYHQPILRLDAGSQKTFTALTGEPAKAYKDLVEGLAQLESERWLLRACFVSSPVDNSSEAEVRSWLAQVAKLAPSGLQLTTPPKADRSKKLQPVSKSRLEAIAEAAAKKTGLNVAIVSAA